VSLSSQIFPALQLADSISLSPAAASESNKSSPTEKGRLTSSRFYLSGDKRLLAII
jgi:hypothetical protein